LIGQSRFQVLAAAGAVRQRHRAVTLVATAEVDAQIHYDSVQPCIKARLALETVQILVRLDERLLRQLQGIVAVVHHAHRYGEDFPLVPFDELAKCLLVPAATLANELPVATFHGGILAP
jgi:hypothetical protein